MQDIKKKHYLTGAVILISNIIFVPLFSYVYGCATGEILRNFVFSVFFSLGLAYYYFYCMSANRFDYDNYEHPYRFLMAFGLSLMLSLLFPIIDAGGWIYLSIGVSIALLSNSCMGMYITSGFIMYSCMLNKEADIYTFMVYFLSSALGIILFQEIDQEFDVIHSLAISVIIQFVIEIAGFVLLKNAELSAEQFIIPLVNVILDGMIIFFVLKYFNDKVANKYRNKYLELNDQEYSVLVELKQKNPKEYWRTIHTAYLVDRMAYAIGCDVDMARSLAYYHRIKKVFAYSPALTDKFLKDNQFPPDAAKALIRYWSRNNHLETKEECIVFISTNMISSLQTLFAKDKDAKVNYEELYNTLFNKDFMKKALEDCDLSIKDLRLIKEVVLKERLYYDFLR